MNKTSNIFKNSCIRDKAGSNYLQQEKLIALGVAISTMMYEEFEDPCNFLIATDTRASGQAIKEALIQGLSTHNHEIYDAGICPTPFVAKAVRDYKEDQDEYEDTDDFDEEEDSFFTLGFVITASHNPAEYNGIKILTEFGYLTEEIELEISRIYHEIMQQGNFKLNAQKTSCIDIDLVSFYQDQLDQELNNLPLKNISVLLDCANGATALIAPKIFKAVGIQAISVNNEQDGTKINSDSGCGNPQLLLEEIKKNKTTWGCAFDGDGDRVTIVHESGKIFDGDDLLVILTQNNNYQELKTVVGTIMTNQGVIEFLQKNNISVLRANVGERNIIQKLMTNQAMIGSEPCGHITIMEHAFCSDGIFAALLFFDTIQNNPELLNLNYSKYAQAHSSIPLKNKFIDRKMINVIVSKYLSTDIRIIVRPSNTEPILRIMVEHKDQQHAEKILQELKNDFLKLIS
jgi:phosphoglucosamine mutase